MAKKLADARPAPQIVTVPAEILRKILDWQVELKSLRERASELDAAIKESSAPLVDLLESGAVPEPGCGLLASIKVDVRRNVKWKEAYVGLAGEAAARRLHDECPPVTTKSLVIVAQASRFK